MRGLALLAALLCSANALGQVTPIVRAEISPQVVNVGEPTELTVTVLVPSWFTRPTVYPSFEVANAITRVPADSSYSLRERVGGESWSGIVRTYQVYPLLGANYRLTGQTLRVTYANPGSAPTSVDVDIPDVSFRGQVPAGAESLDPYLAGDSLSLALTVEGEVSDLKVGDALVLNYVAELDGLPAIFIPTLAPALQFEGVSAYAEAPRVVDTATAQRSEKVTLVFEAGGEFTVPDRTLSYWNASKGTVDTTVAKGLTFTVDGPVAAEPATEPPATVQWRQISIVVAAFAALSLVLWRTLPAIAKRQRRRAEERRLSEPYAFDQVLAAIADNDPRNAYHEVLRWLRRLAPEMSLREFALAYGSEALQAWVTNLLAGLYAQDGGATQPQQSIAELKSARKYYLQQCSNKQRQMLPGLNP